MSLSYKIIPSRFKNITLCLGISMLCFLSVTFLTGSIFGININGDISSNNASALTYSTEQDISFTFAPSLSITLSDTDLIIDTLAPGNTAESNTITVSVASNTPYGYALYADVGSNDTSSKYYDTSDLIRSDNINATFTSIATNASQASLTTDNTWGYSTSSDNGTTWSTYNGLPTATSTGGSTSTDSPAVLIDTKLPADNQSIALKVAARSSTTQASGAYSNIINFYAVGKPQPPPQLYDKVASMSKGYQTAAQLQEDITTSNSGVFKYSGSSSDEPSGYNIYYYRGVLEPEADQGEYGSDGKATSYPNYIKLGNDTCWRIIRTTESGGIKIIYNGIWNSADSTCANSTTDAQTIDLPFNADSAAIQGKIYYGLGKNNIRSVGYTYADTLSDSARVAEVFSDNIHPSIIKQYIEEWFSTNMVTPNRDYTEDLEVGAGYCNDRSLYNFNAYGNYTRIVGTTKISTIGGPYVPALRFGAYTRYHAGFSQLSLGCPNGTTDLYTASSGGRVGNEQLDYPVALITADEIGLAGSGTSASTSASSYNVKSWLNTGHNFWTMSPSERSYWDYGVNMYVLLSTGQGAGASIDKEYGVRPVISLKPGTAIASGTATATDPWLVSAP